MSAADAGLPAALALLFNALTWGVSWWPFRQLQGLGLHPLWLTAILFTLALPAVIVVRPAALGELLRTPALWLLAAAAGTTNACFNWAVTTGDVVRVVLLFYLMPLWAVLLARPLLGERIGARAAARVALALAGALVVLWPEHGGWPLPRSLADALGLAGGFAFAVNNVLLRRAAHRSNAARALAMFSGGALVALVLALALTLAGAVPPPPAPAPAWLLGSAVLAAWFVLSNLALQYGAARLPVHATAVIMMTEVFFAGASAVALGAGELGWRTVVGGSSILCGAALATWQRD